MYPQEEILHDSGPYTGYPPPPPPTPSATVLRGGGGILGSEAGYVNPAATMATATAAVNIQDAIAREVTEGIEEDKGFGQSLLRGLKKYLVPAGTLLDIISASLRFLTLGFLLLLPDLYNDIFYPKPGQSFAWGFHYGILGLSLGGIAIGVPVALFSAVYSLVTLLNKLEATEHITKRAIKRQRQQYFRRKIRGAWRYIGVAFLAGVAISIPYFMSNDRRVPAETKQLIAEGVFIVVPFVCSIITMITEREANADPQERSSKMGVNLGLFQTFAAGLRLASGQGTFRDAAAVQASMNGDIGASIEAGVAEDPSIKYLSLAEIAVMLGRSPAKDDPFRRTLINVVGAAARSGQYGIIKHPKDGYKVPEEHFARLFSRYLGGKAIETGSKQEADKASKNVKSGGKQVEKTIILKIGPFVVRRRKAA